MAVPIPLQDPVARPKRPEYADKRDPLEGTATLPWIQFWQAQADTFSEAPTKITTPVSLTAQDASIGTTPIPTASLASGLYRVSYAARVTVAGSVSSSLTVTITWTAGAVTQSIVGAAMTGNTTATFQTATYLIKIDQGTPVSYATTYADGGGAVAMQYELSVVLELVS